MLGYTRYVALGDSQTEGLWDGDDAAGLTGFADRLAALVDTHHPGLRYANLAVRGKQIRDVLSEQLPLAVAMRADLITVCIGMNDVTRPGPGFDDALTQLDELYERLAGTGATVVTTTFPDLTRILPIGGHMLFAAAAAEALGLPGSSHDWARPDPAAAPPSLRSRTYSQVLWTRNMLMPWVWRHLRGRSSGEGRAPRRPALQQLTD